MLAVEYNIPCSLFLYSHLFPSSINDLSCPNPVLMIELAKFCLALLTAPDPKAGLNIVKMAFINIILGLSLHDVQFSGKIQEMIVQVGVTHNLGQVIVILPLPRQLQVELVPA